MRHLRILRIILSVIFLASSAAYFAGWEWLRGFSSLSHHLQILPMMFAETAGIIAVWIFITLLWGRIYCSSVCPVGTLLDGASFFRRFRRRRRTYRYQHASRYRLIVLLIYIVLVVCGLTGVSLIIDPWNMFGNCAGSFGAMGSSEEWKLFGIGTGIGCGIGIVSLLIIAVSGFYFGRDYCNSVCPVGIALSVVSSRSIYNIYIEPDKCDGCMKCEEVCGAGCIKVVSRYVDNTRCVRCLNCLDVCRPKAIQFRAGMPRVSTPLLHRTTRTKI